MAAAVPRKRRSTMAVALAVAALGIVLAVAWRWSATTGSRPPLRVSPETTAITAPLDEEGYPDYGRALLERLSAGLTPENNAAIPLLVAMWPYGEGYDGDPDDGARVWAALGMKGEPPTGPAITPLDTPERRVTAEAFLRERFAAAKAASGGLGVDSIESGLNNETNADELARDLLSYCEPVRRPWMRSDLPFLADWLDENEAAIDRLRDGLLNRSQFYAPPTGLLHDPRARLLEALPVNELAACRSAERILATRCHWRLGQGDVAQAMEDALAIIQLGKDLARGPYYLDNLIGYALLRNGAAEVARVAEAPACDAATLRVAAEGLGPHNATDGFHRASEFGERWFTLAALIEEFWRGTSSDDPDVGFAYSLLGNSEQVDYYGERLRGTTFDGNHVLREVNAAFDRLEAIAAKPRAEAWDAIAAWDQGIAAELESEGFTLRTFAGRTEVASIVAVHNATLSASVAFRSERLARNRLALVRTAIDLAVLRRERGAYPGTLDGIGESPPRDAFRGESLRYRRDEDGFLLWSVGPDGVDDGGSQRGVWGDAVVFEGVPVDMFYNPDTELLVSRNPEAQAMLDQIPEGADDEALRVPMTAAEPWPWEELPAWRVMMRAP